jgi:hypothetical protein
LFRIRSPDLNKFRSRALSALNARFIRRSAPDACAVPPNVSCNNPDAVLGKAQGKPGGSEIFSPKL